MFAFFTHPEFLGVAAALISVPIIIHLINRLRFKRLKWAAMEFLLKAQKRNRRRLIIEQLLLLLMRCLLVGLLGVLVMRFVGTSFAELGVKNSVHVVLLDDSLSMNDRWKVGKGYRNCFDAARKDLLLDKIGKGIKESPTGSDRLIIVPLSWAAADEPAGELMSGLGSEDTRLGAITQVTQQARRALAGNTLLRVDSEQILVTKIDKDSNAATLQRGMNGTTPAVHKAGTPLYFIGKYYDSLKEKEGYEAFEKDLAELKATNLHLDLHEGVKRARSLVADEANTLLTLHVLSDFRRQDWGAAEPLYKELLEFSKQRRVRVRLLDPIDPPRTTQGGTPAHRDNLGIVDLRPSSRVVGKGMPVIFTATVANYGRQKALVKLDIVDHATGQRKPEIDFIPSRFEIKAGKMGQVTFEARFTNIELKPGVPYYAAISAHLVGDLEKDGLEHDNVAYGVVEVRDQVPVLIVDGEGKLGRTDDKKGLDSYFLQQALLSAPGAQKSDREDGPASATVHPYRVDFGDELGEGVAMRALESADLRKYPTIFLANVPQLTPRQLENLENYVRDGGGVAFFLGPNVNVPFYNKSLYKEGKGIFPLALKDPYHPPPAKEKLEPQPVKGVPMLQLRDDLSPYPIFGPIFKNADQLGFLEDLSVFRYFKPAKQRLDPHVVELATLPNDRPITDYQKEVLDIASTIKPSRLGKLLARQQFQKYSTSFDLLRTKLEDLVKPESQFGAYVLSVWLERLLKDSADVEEFWNNVDPEVQALKTEVARLYQQVRTGDGSPFVLASEHGKGKVVVVMSTAGSAWNYWSGGNAATTVYQPFIWEMQKYLSAQSADTNLTVGSPAVVSVDSRPYKLDKGRLKMTRTLLRAVSEKKYEPIAADKGQTSQEKDDMVTFRYADTFEPGVYVSELRYHEDGKQADGKAKDAGPALASFVHVYNVDALREGNLERVSNDHVKTSLIDKGEKLIVFEGPGVDPDIVVTKPNDLSESPWFFLAFLVLLVAEQALAVHLSFHVKEDSHGLAPATGMPRQEARAA